jgi:hypothetical protein
MRKALQPYKGATHPATPLVNLPSNITNNQESRPPGSRAAFLAAFEGAPIPLLLITNLPACAPEISRAA